MIDLARIDIRIDPFPPEAAFRALWRDSWGSDWQGPLPDWRISLAHLGAYEGDRLVGYLNIATDGGGHAFLLDPTVHPDVRRKGLGTQLVSARSPSRENAAAAGCMSITNPSLKPSMLPAAFDRRAPDLFSWTTPADRARQQRNHRPGGISWPSR